MKTRKTQQKLFFHEMVNHFIFHFFLINFSLCFSCFYYYFLLKQNAECVIKNGRTKNIIFKTKNYTEQNHY